MSKPKDNLPVVLLGVFLSLGTIAGIVAFGRKKAPNANDPNAATPFPSNGTST